MNSLRCWQFAVSGFATRTLPSGTKIGYFDIEHAVTDNTSLTPEFVLRLALVAKSPGKADLVVREHQPDAWFARRLCK